MIVLFQVLKICCLDDWYFYFCDGDMLKTVVLYISEIYGWVIVMFNLVLFVIIVEVVVVYCQCIFDVVFVGYDFILLMICYLTDLLDFNELECGFNEGVFIVVKFYLVNVIINFSYGVMLVDVIMLVFECMEKIGMLLLVYGEVIYVDIDIFDCEVCFIESVMELLCQCLIVLKVVFEYIIIKDVVDYVCDGNEWLVVIIILQYLMFNCNYMLVGGVCLYLYCLFIFKCNIY